MLIEVDVDGNRTLLNMDNVQAITESGDSTDIYTQSGMISVNMRYDDFAEFLSSTDIEIGNNGNDNGNS